jgi:hypothetical protein
MSQFGTAESLDWYIGRKVSEKCTDSVLGVCRDRLQAAQPTERGQLPSRCNRHYPYPSYPVIPFCCSVFFFCAHFFTAVPAIT